MGTPKMLLPFGKSTIIETVIDNVLRSRADSIHVVLGASYEEIRDSISHLPVHCCHNANHASGMLSSAICGVESLPPSTGSVLFIPGDQPLISHGVIDAVIGAYMSSERGIVVPIHSGRRGHPLLADYKYRDQIIRLDPERGLRALREHYPGDVLEVKVRDSGILADIDTPSDYIKAKTKVL